ncbi:hypothetical protein B5V00_14900 [Geothermobacter hydrogeniphilus]|uniref:Uncharacterized protein n=1 Tax=Geothermobacter hydrogeniphilus TaxID=1969733 RepID=A0A1X0XSJ1_9BACT|nr:hypothetical protein B5V00_14900 [Geothermobacter hydrogeniphilus]
MATDNKQHSIQKQIQELDDTNLDLNFFSLDLPTNKVQILQKILQKQQHIIHFHQQKKAQMTTTVQRNAMLTLT